MSILLKIIGIIIVISAIGISYLWVKYSPKKIISYIAENPNNGSIYLARNGTTVLDKNSDNLMPLASTVKIIIAIEFARQAAANIIDSDKKIALSELDKFYIKNTDGGAHQGWIKNINRKQLIDNGYVSLSEVARGMIEFSSNANTEYLLGKLGFDNVNKSLELLELNKHEQLYPFVSCLLVLRDHPIHELQIMPKEEYVKLSHKVHDKLKDGKISNHISKKDVTLEKQKFFSDWFTQGTTKEYASILKTINDRSFFSNREQEYIDDILKYPFDSSGVIHGGEKGGSTMSILTIAVYETTRDGNKTEFALFLKDLTAFQNIMYSLTMTKLKADLLTGNNLHEYEKLLR